MTQLTIETRLPPIGEQSDHSIAVSRSKAGFLIRTVTLTLSQDEVRQLDEQIDTLKHWIATTGGQNRLQVARLSRLKAQRTFIQLVCQEVDRAILERGRQSPSEPDEESGD